MLKWDMGFQFAESGLIGAKAGIIVPSTILYVLVVTTSHLVIVQ